MSVPNDQAVCQEIQHHVPLGLAGRRQHFGGALDDPERTFCKRPEKASGIHVPSDGGKTKFGTRSIPRRNEPAGEQISRIGGICFSNLNTMLPLATCKAVSRGLASSRRMFS